MHSTGWTVVIVTDFAHVNGGAGLIALSSARELAHRGHSVVIFSAVGPIDPSLENAGIRVVCTGQPEILQNPDRVSAAVQGIWNRSAAAEMTELLRPLDPRRTLVHVHGFTKALSSSIIPVALAHGAGVVVTAHEYFLACPNGGFFNYVSEQNCHLIPLSAACVMTNCDSRSYLQKLWRVARQKVQISAGRLPSAVRHFITYSNLARSVIEPFLPVGASLYDIKNPIDVDTTPPIIAGCERSVVYVGRLASEKGIVLAAEAARRANTCLKFVGDGYLRGRLETQYPECEITGWMSSEAVHNQLKSSRALVFPSLWYETQGLVVLEAAAHGVPAIVADSSAARESVVDGETGLWFRGGNVEDLTQKLRMLQDDELATRLGIAAHSRFWKSAPTLVKHVDQLERCYEHVLSS